MNLFAYSHNEDVLTKELLRILDGNSNWICLDVLSFIEKVQIREWIDQGETRQEWFLGTTRLMEFAENRFLDRIFSLAPADHFFRDRRFAHLEWESLLFYRRRNDRHHIPTTLNTEPWRWKITRPEQWAIVEGSISDVSVPAFEFPYRPEESCLPSDRLVVTTLDNQAMWRPGQHYTGAGALGFERPPGKPISVLATPKGYALGTPRAAGELAMSICEIFNIWFAEVILFDDNGRFHFGQISAQPSKMHSAETINSFLADQLNGVGA